MHLSSLHVPVATPTIATFCAILLSLGVFAQMHRILEHYKLELARKRFGGPPEDAPPLGKPSAKRPRVDGGGSGGAGAMPSRAMYGGGAGNGMAGADVTDYSRSRPKRQVGSQNCCRAPSIVYLATSIPD